MDITIIINNIYPLPHPSFDRLVQLVDETDYPKHFHLFRENVKGRKAYFLKKGLVRAYSTEDGKDVTFWFGKDGDIIFPLQTLFAGLSEYASVELLEDSILYELDLPRLEELYASDIHIANWGRRYAERACIEAEKLFISRQYKDSADKYRQLIADFPGITLRVPLGIIASFLGISQANLSRIRAKVR